MKNFLFSLSILLLIFPFPTLLSNPEQKSEVFAFVLKTTPDVWMRFQWSKLTTICLFGFVDPDLIRYAHLHGVKVVGLAQVDKDKLLDESYRRRWVKEQVKHALEHNLDGVNVDFEDSLEEHSEESQAFTRLVEDLTESFQDTITGSQVSIDVAWSPDCIDDRCYDYLALSKAVDLVFVMGYDEQSQMWDADPKNCLAKSNAPLWKTKSGLEKYLALGLNASKVVLGVPWYGYVYPCVDFNSKESLCRIRSVPFRGCPCSDAAGNEKEYTKLMKDLASESSFGLRWDTDSQSPTFNYQRDDSTIMQVWFDDARSLKLKYDMAHQIGLKGVGIWTINFLDYQNDTEVQEMWSILP